MIEYDFRQNFKCFLSLQVSSVMLNKDGQIEQMIRQLKNREVAIGLMKKEIEAKTKKIANLETLLTRTQNKTTITIV